MHDSAHHTLAKNRAVNEILGQLTCDMVPPPLRAMFRHVHLSIIASKGHRVIPISSSGKGQDWTFPRSRVSLMRPSSRIVSFGALGVMGYPEALRAGSPRDPRLGIKIAKAAFYGMVLLVIVRTGVWIGVLAYWIAPMRTALKGFVRVREIAKHYGVQGKSALTRTRTDTRFEH